MNDPLNHLEAIKNNWHSHPDTCINVSSADMLQFAMFFAVVRQSNMIEPLNLATPNVIAKRNLLKTGFAWGRPDEVRPETHVASSKCDKSSFVIFALLARVRYYVGGKSSGLLPSE